MKSRIPNSRTDDRPELDCAARATQSDTTKTSINTAFASEMLMRRTTRFSVWSGRRTAMSGEYAGH